MTDYGCDPAVHILGDSAAAVALMRDAAGKAGARILSAMPAEAGVHAGLAPGAALLIELEDETAGAAALLDLAAAEAARDPRRAVVSVPLVLLDLAAARMAYPGIELLCAAKEADRLAAITRLREPPDTGVREGRRDSQPFLLPARPDDDLSPFGKAEAREAAAFLRAMLRARRLRDDYFRGGLFGDPVWDMLLDLMAARLEGKTVSVSSLCIAAAVPPTTALRWIGTQTTKGLLVRDSDPGDRRRVNLALSERTARAMGAWLRRVRAAGEPQA